MKLLFRLLLLIFTIEYIQCGNKPIRTYKVYPDNSITKTTLISYTVKDFSQKINLYKLSTTSATDIDTIELTYPSKTMIANIEGEWAEKVFNVTYSIYDKKSNKWIDGSFEKLPGEIFSTRWNSIRLTASTKWYSRTMKIVKKPRNELLAEIRKRTPFFGASHFEVKVYSNECPDAIYFFIMAMNDHRVQLASLIE